MQLGVASVVVGGRPTAGPMQSVAGVEGAQVFPMLEIGAAASAAVTLSTGSSSSNMSSELAELAEGYALARAATATNPGSVNGKNAFSAHDAETPLQFLYQAANCRFFYTAEMVRGPGAVWRRAVDAVWGDPAQFCVEGSRVAVNGTAGGVDPRFRAPVGFSAGASVTPGVGLSVVVAALVVVVYMI